MPLMHEECREAWLKTASTQSGLPERLESTARLSETLSTQQRLSLIFDAGCGAVSMSRIAAVRPRLPHRDCRPILHTALHQFHACDATIMDASHLLSQSHMFLMSVWLQPQQRLVLL